MTCVLVTRPPEDAAPLADDLAQMGFDVMLEPLMRVRYFEDVIIDLKNTQGLLFTSANGVRAFAHLNSTRTLSCFCVGDATAREAKSLGFTDIHTASGDVDKLADLVASSCNPTAGNLYHAAASAVAGDLAGMLADNGFGYVRGILYEAVPTKALTDQTIKAIIAGNIDAILLFSPRTARGFIENFEKAELTGKANDLSLFCLSLNVENEVKAMDWKMLVTANQPNQKALLAILNEKMG